MFFRVFDLDDPSDTDIVYVNNAGQSRTSKATDLDSNGPKGDDNRPDGTTTPAQGSLSANSATTDANGDASVVLTISRQPGNNFAATASMDSSYSGGLRLRATDGTVVEDSSGTAVPVGAANTSSRAVRTDMLTVWRTLHFEVDRMGNVSGNVVRGTVKGVRAGTAKNTTEVTIENIGAPGLLGTDGLLNRFERGRFRVNNGNYSSVISNTANVLGNDVVVINGALANNVVGQAYELEDDDYRDFPEGASFAEPRHKQAGAVFRSSLHRRGVRPVKRHSRRPVQDK